MRVILIIYSALFLFTTSSFGQMLKETVKDIDGNIYRTIKIGKQIWMVEALKTTKFNNGSEIPNVKDNSDWSKLKSEAYCNYYNKTDNVEKSGRLYNWFAINDAKGICPLGWHVPTDGDWLILENFLTSNTEINKYKGWWSYHLHGQSYLPLDYRDVNGSFPNENSMIKSNYGGWWTSTEISSSNAKRRFVGFSSYSIIADDYDKRAGFSVICIKD